MNASLDDTIAALASPPGPAARGIVRISGAATRTQVARFFRADNPSQWELARRAAHYRGRWRLTASELTLPVSMHFWPNCRSYTGQPTAEIHAIGSPPLLEAILSDLCTVGVRSARPGEFTLRAFLAGRVDLVQAEAVLGVIDAHDHRELETALQQLAGGLSGFLAQVRGSLLDLLADLEAGLDFVDEDIEFVSQTVVLERLATARHALEALLKQASDRMQSTGRMRVVLAGLPNAGKSTLFNALTGRDAALVSELKGTTRDYLSTPLEWNGVSFDLIDTAGWESAAAGIESAAQQLRNAQITRADLVLWCRACNLTAQERDFDRCLCESLERDNRVPLILATKCDLSPDNPLEADASVSARSGRGMAELSEAVSRRLTQIVPAGRQFVGTTAARCRESLQGAIASLVEGEHSAARAAGDEIVAIEVRAALQHLGTILGVVYTDDVLDRIFSRFCIGK